MHITIEFLKRFSITALRFKTAAISRFIHATAFSHLAQSKPHPTRAMISLKSHSVMPFKLPARGGWIDRDRCQFLVRQPTAGRALDLGAQALDQFGRTFVRIHRIAAQTWTITALQRFVRCREEIDILLRRLFRAAGRPAENSRRAHRDKKYAFETRIAI